MKTSVTVINIPESVKISIKGSTYTYRVTSEYINISATGRIRQANDCIVRLPGT